MNKHNLLSLWKYFNTAIWGYSTVIFFLILAGILIPSNTYNSSPFNLVDILISAPILIFFIGVTIQYKHYKWNWWKNLLGAYSLFFTLLFTIILIVSTKPSQTAHSFTFGPFLLFLPVFIFLVVVGKEIVLPKSNN